MDAAFSFAGKVLELTVEPVARQFGYLLFHSGYVRELMDEIEKLQGQRDSLQHEVDEARRNAEGIEDNVLNWLDRVHQITERAEDFSEEERKARTGCSMRSCPNPWSRYWLSKKARKITLEVTKLKQDRNDLKRISYRKAPSPRWVMTSSTSFSGGNEAFDSRVSTMDEIMDALADPTINKIGLYGLPGVGKSTMAHEVADKARREKKFDWVVVAEVRQNPDFKKIQQDIGEMLGLKFDEESEFARAGRLCGRLKQEKNVLVILDDLWDRLDLGKIGIPSAVDYEGNKMGIHSSAEYKGCKLLLTSRNKELLSNQMNCEKNIMLGVLSEEEAWKLFKEKAKVQVDSDPDLQSIATDVAKECAGLPIAIVVVATALGNKSLSEWRNALRQLQNPTSRDVTGLRKGVYAPIKLSYDNLEAEELKLVFLLSSTWSDSVFTSHLLNYCIGLGLFEGMDTIEGARDSLNTWISKLKASCLFLDSSSDDCFTMHDVVRDVALSILSDEHRALTMRYNKWDKWPENDQSENYKWIFLYQSDIGKLAEELSCPRLELFRLNNKDHDVRIPNDFFKELCGLRVIDLTEVNLPFLPDSITHLKNLRTLCLDYCELGDMSMIGELKNLRALSLRGSIIQQLPRELRDLMQLQLIDLTNCYKLKVIPPNVISKLKKLEQMQLERSFNQWQHEESNNESSTNANLSELMDLPNLSALHIHIPHASMLRKDMFSDRLKKYRILIGDVWEWSDMNKTSRTLKLKLNISIHSETSGVKRLMDRVEDLFLDEVNGINSVLSEFNRAGFPYLKHLQIQNNSQIQCIIKLRQADSHDAFPNLETLVLENMINLEKLCHGKLPGNSFSKLRVIKVRNGDKLNNLLPVSIVRSLPKLNEIEVSGCKLMQEIVDLSDQETDDEGAVEFHQLRILTMSSLPALVGFCFDDRRSLATAPRKEKQFETASNSNVIIEEDKPHPPNRLFNKVAFPKLDTLKLSTLNFENIWHDSILASSWVQNLTDLSIEGCGSLRYIMPTALATRFMKLKHLNICGCEMVEMIIFPNPETSNTFSEEVIFPSLETMVISHMDNLQMIWPNQFAPNSYGKIKKVEICYCKKLITIIPSHVLSTLVQLETLTVSHCDSLDTIYDLQGVNIGEAREKLAMQLRNLSLDNLSNLRNIWNNDSYSFLSFDSLQTVRVIDCECLRRIFPASLVISLVQLERLHIEACGIEEIVGNEGQADADISFVLPRITFLVLWNLSKLKRFFPGKYTLDCPKLKELVVIDCDKMELFGTEPTAFTATHDQAVGQLEVQTQLPLFQFEKVIPYLESFSLDGKDFIKISQSILPEDLFHSMREIGLQKIESKAVQFPYWFLHRMPNLQTVGVQLGSYKEIFPRRSLVAEERQTADVVRLRNLYLGDLLQLEYICKEGHQLDPVLEKLEELYVARCSGLTNLIPASASFNCLTLLEVSNCHGLVNLIAVSTAKSLFHLTRLTIKECRMLQEIVKKVEDETEDEISFRRLQYLEITHLPSLTSFCQENCSFDFPWLEKVIVRQCPRMKIFSQGNSKTPRLLDIIQEDGQSSWKEDLNLTIELLFREKIAFRCMEKVELHEYPELMEMWEAKVPIWSTFSNLKSLIVDSCHSLSYVIPSNLLCSLYHLEELDVHNSNSIEAVFDLQDIKEPHTLPRLQLRSIILRHLPKLKCVWNKDPQEINFCQQLQKVFVLECESLRSIFPASIAKRLPKLEVLDIDSCNGVEVIVEKDEVARAVPCFVFPQLYLLKLWRLPNLKNFYAERHTSKWPQLKQLKVYYCIKLKVFGSEVPSIALTAENDGYQTRHPLCLIEEVIPKLQEVVLNQKAVTKIKNGQFQDDLFHNVKVLYLESFLDDHVPFPYSFLERFPSLQELYVYTSWFEELFPCQVPLGAFARKIVPFKNLTLSFLVKLKNICNEDHQSEQILQNLESLKVTDCAALITLTPSSASFDNLTDLEVFRCDQLMYLITSSTAKSLVHLMRLKINECKMMEEVVTVKEENWGNTIAMHRLEYLELIGLPSLKAFCSSSNYTLVFPSLYQVILRQCPRLGMFCAGVLATPILEGVEVEEDKVRWEGNLNKTIRQPFEDKYMQLLFNSNFRCMEKVELHEYPELMEMLEAKVPIWSMFSNLKSLIVDSCHSLSYVIPSNLLCSLNHLKELDVHNSNSIEAVFDLQDIKEPHTLPQLQLRSIILRHLPKLKCVWNKDPQEINFCQQLQKVFVLECESLRSIFPASIAKQLPKLEVLDIDSCNGVEVIVEKDEVAGAVPCFVFPQLYLLRLWRLPNLKNFYAERHTSKWPQLKQLKVYYCIKLKVFGSEVPSIALTAENDGYQTRHPLCLIEEVIPKLQEVVLNQKAITKIKNGQFQDDLFHNVKVLYLESFLDDHVPFRYSFLERFPSLRELYVYTSRFEELFHCPVPLGALARKIAPLKKLTLSSLKKLKNICNEDYQSEQILQNLESLKVTDCAALITLTPSSASFDNLTDLEVFRCNQLMYLITSSTAKSLVHLMRLKINECKMMEEVVSVKEENWGNTIAMHRLECLELIGLSSLKAFCSSSNYTLVFPSLYQVILRLCPRLGMFCAGVLATPILEGVEVEEDKVRWEGNLNKTIRQLFEDKIAFFCMEKVELHEYPELMGMWKAKVPVWSTYSNLKSLIVDSCHSLSYVIPSNLLYSLNYLEELDVRNSNFIEAVFDLQHVKVGHTLPQLQLRSMILWHLPKLKCVWNKDPQQINFCQHLLKIKAFNCESLRSIFPVSIAKQLPKLEVLDIDSCKGVEVIVEKDEVARAVPCFVFPQLYLLSLWRLPNLKNFYAGRHTSKWPQLKQMKVYGCNKLKVFRSEVPSIALTAENDGYQTRHPLCLIEEVVPNLEELVLNKKAVNMIRNGQFPTDLFHKVKLLYLESFKNESVAFPYSFLERFPNLNELDVWNCSSFEEIFSCEGATSNNEGRYAPLKILRLHYLEQLKSIWHSDSQPELLQNLERLEVLCCSSLITLAPSTTSFDSLTNLNVSGCDQLIYLVTSSTAKSLAHLTSLKVKDCKMIEEIIADEGENEEKEIWFKELECLELSGLPSLNSFCSHDHTLNIASLYEVTVKGCHKMKIFCPGTLVTPLLEGVKADDNGQHWEEDLNKTIRQLFSEKIAFRCMEKVELHEYPELMEMWEAKVPIWSTFSNLKSLIVDSCHSLSYVIPSNLLCSLNYLEELDVRNSNCIEAVFDLQDIKEPHELPQLQLRSMILEHLPKLKCVWNKDPQQINFCQHLRKIEAFDCESLRSIFPVSIAKQLPKLEVLDIDSCNWVEIIVEKDEVGRAAPCFVFPQLYLLKLWNLPNLKNFYAERHTSKWPQLKQLRVYRCMKLKVFGSEFPSIELTAENDGYQTQQPLCLIEKVIPKLQEVVLNQKAITKIKNGQFQDDLFHNVKVLYLESFLDDHVPFRYSFLERFPSLRELYVYTSRFEELFHCPVPLGALARKIAPLKKLTLSSLKKLKNICNDDNQSAQILRNLESLKVTDCAALITLTPFSASFDNLTDLGVFRCDQLMYLITSSTAESLVHLTSLKVKDCKRIEEIIADEGENKEKEISFGELECLELTGLPSLKSFCSQDYKFIFPSLDDVTLTGCPNMKIFCPGDLATPLLKGVKAD